MAVIEEIEIQINADLVARLEAAGKQIAFEQVQEIASKALKELEAKS